LLLEKAINLNEGRRNTRTRVLKSIKSVVKLARNALYKFNF